MLKITGVSEESVGGELGIRAGDALIGFDDEPVIDVLDYYYYDGQENFVITVRDCDGTITDYEIEKDAAETLGLSFEEEPVTKCCRNKCIFCFVDQLPAGMRETLYVKDDDWRLSFISGNYVTLTNLKDGEPDRIINRHFSPVYISVHATDKAVRNRLLGRKKDSDIMPLIKKLYDGGIEIHAQCVVCPGINDGEILTKSIEELAPYVSSLAVVPVGLTKFANVGITPYDALSAAATLDIVAAAQKKQLKAYGKRIVFAADELYLKAEKSMPEFSEYEDFPQIENGVGMCAMFLDSVSEALAGLPPDAAAGYKKITFATGTAAYGLIKKCAELIESKLDICIDVRAVNNEFFGHSVNVAGLITGGDLIRGLSGTDSECVMITRNMLKETEDVFLDGITLSEAEKILDTKIIPVINDGEKLLNEIVRKVN